MRTADDARPDNNLCRPADYREPALIVGVEADVGNRHDWHDVSARQPGGLVPLRRKSPLC